VTESLHAELAILSFADFPSAPLIHAASLRCKGCRILLAGPKGSGKTMLILHLIREGYEIEGDENVFVTSAGVAPRPCGLRVKESAVAFLPRLDAAFSEAPYYQTARSTTRVSSSNPAGPPTPAPTHCLDCTR
jgi:GTPase SAR1 family protein